MDWFAIIKTVHIIGATILFGTGLGIAFFMFRSHFTDDVHEKLYAARTTVLADYLFTLPAAILQPISGVTLICLVGYDWTELWLLITYGLYLLAAACWLPVVWIQIQLKQMLREAADTGAPLPARYDRLFQLWFALGWPAFIGLIVVFFLMVAKPA